MYCFPIGTYFLVIDSENYINLMRIPLGDLNIEDTTSQPLDIYKSEKEQKVFNCSIENFAELLSICDQEECTDDKSNIFNASLLVYDCQVGMISNVMKMTLVQIFNKIENNDNIFDYTV